MRTVALAALPLLLFTACASVGSESDGPAIGRVWTEYRTADSFERIRDYFRKEDESQGGRVLRTRDDDRAGYYFLLRIENPGTPIPSALLEVSVIMPGSDEPRVFPFRAEIPEGNLVLNLGITGADWPGERIRPLAWRVRLAAVAGAQTGVLAESRSFLWSDPADTRKSE